MRIHGLALAWTVVLLSGVASANERHAMDTRDCANCPRMVVIPSGTFTMGSPLDEPDRLRSEGPRADVAVADFAIGASEVTRGQYAAFVKATHRPPPVHGCYQFGFNPVDVSAPDASTMTPDGSWRNPGFPQTDDHPVTCISWQDASDYAAWLAKKTGKAYRLPSEAEWEYAARAGVQTRFFWGVDENAACGFANVADPVLLRANATVRRLIEEAMSKGDQTLRIPSCEDGVPYTSPVAKFRANAFGLYDVTGNVWEYVADCWQESLPESGSAYQSSGCDSRRVRGGSWDDTPPEMRLARRSRVKPDVPRNDAGFRVARDLAAAEKLKRP